MFEVFVDSGANIPSTVVDEFGINVLPLAVYVDEVETPAYVPGLTLEQEREKGHEYYQRIREGALVRTSLVTCQQFEEAFRKALEAGHDVLYYSLSKNISGTYNAARLAKDDLQLEFPDRKIILIDSLNASLAQGIMAIYAVEMGREGKTIEEAAEYTESIVGRMNGLFTVDDLKYLARTGRLSNFKAGMGNILSLKPILKGNKDGFIVQCSTVKGRKKSLGTLIDLVCNNIENPEEQIIGIAHADCYEESLFVIDEILKRVKVRRVINTTYDYCTGSHVGPDTIALFFMAKDRELEK